VLDELMELGVGFRFLDLNKVKVHHDSIKSENKHWRKQIATLNFLFSLSVVNFIVKQNYLNKTA
jgi:hypothetical protein